MRRVAVFGNAGGGKSTLARQLAAITGLPLYVVDKLQWQDGGAAVPHDVYLNLHRDLMAKEVWIIDGYGDTATVLERCSVADTLIHVDLPLPIHYWWVTKRLIMGLFADPAGWPKGSPLWSSTMSGYRVIPQCHKYLTPRYRQLISEMATSKFVVHLRSPREIRAFLDNVRSELTHQTAIGTTLPVEGWAERVAMPRNSDVDLLRDRQGIIDLHAEISDRAFDVGMAKQKLHSSKVASAAVDQRRLGSSE